LRWRRRGGATSKQPHLVIGKGDLLSSYNISTSVGKNKTVLTII
jgi:hypothetical protein